MKDSRPEEDIFLKKENLEFGLEFLEPLYGTYLPPDFTSESKLEHIKKLEAKKERFLKEIEN